MMSPNAVEPCAAPSHRCQPAGATLPPYMVIAPTGEPPAESTYSLVTRWFGSTGVASVMMLPPTQPPYAESNQPAIRFPSPRSTPIIFAMPVSRAMLSGLLFHAPMSDHAAMLNDDPALAPVSGSVPLPIVHR